VDRIFAVTPSNDGLDPDELPVLAQDVGLDRGRFESCLASGRYAERVNRDFDDAVASGGEGTPYSIAVTASGKKFVISGAQRYETVKATIEAALREQ
jgi:predicted DsbA family dithiol-disulfide isomerase